MVDLVTITDPYLPEPKGISSATSGMILVADGLGSGDWELRTSFGGLILNNGDGSVEINNIGTTAQKITSFTDSTTTVGGVISDPTTENDLYINITGTYEVSFTGCFSTVAAGDAGQYTIKLRVDGSEPSSPNNLGCTKYFSGTDDLSIMSFSGIVDLATTDALTVWIESDEAGDTDDLSVYELSFTVKLLNR